MTTGSLSRFIFALSLAGGAMVTWSYMYLAFLLLFAISATLVWGVKLSSLYSVLRYSIILVFFVFILHLFSHPGKAFFRIFQLQATNEGAIFGLFYVLKLFTFAIAGAILFATVNPEELISPLERLARVAGPLGKPLEALSLSLFLALRFLPEMTVLGRKTKLAFETRGVAFRGNLIHKAKVASLIMAPLFVNGFKRSELTADALNVKGYATRHTRAVLMPPKFSLGSCAVIVVSIVIIIAGWRTR